MNIQLVSADKLRPNDYNPNRLSEYQRKLLRRSIEADGMIQPVIALKDGTIVDGQHRWEVCKELGIDVPCLYVDKDEEARRITTLRMNAARGVNDIDLETTVFRDLPVETLATELLLDEDTIGMIFDDTQFVPPDFTGNANSDSPEPENSNEQFCPTCKRPF